MGITLEKPFVSLLQVPESALVGGLLDQLIVLWGNLKFNGFCAGRGALVLASCAEIAGGAVKVMACRIEVLKGRIWTSSLVLTASAAHPIA